MEAYESSDVASVFESGLPAVENVQKECQRLNQEYNRVVIPIIVNLVHRISRRTDGEEPLVGVLSVEMHEFERCIEEAVLHFHSAYVASMMLERLVKK